MGTRPPDSANTSQIDVAIASYRSRDLLARCLDALAPSPNDRVQLHVTVVDNGSGDGTLELLGERFPWVDAVDGGDNLGFGTATNLAARRGSSPYLLVLNPDVRVTRADLTTLADVLEKQPDVGVVGPKLLREDGSLDHACRRSFPTISGALGHFTGLGRLERAPGALAQYRAPEVSRGPVDAVNGAFMLIRRAAFDEAGGFDERYWMYMEDLDLCYRLREAGWVTWFEPSVVALHTKAGSSGPLRGPRLNVAFHSGMARFYRSHYAPQRPAVLNLLVYAGIAAKLAGSLVRAELTRALQRP